MNLVLTVLLVALSAVVCRAYDPGSCKIPELEETGLGFEKVSSKEGIKLTKRQSKIQIPACSRKKYAGELCDAQKASESCGEWLKPRRISPLRDLCTERRTFTQTGNYVIYNNRFCLVSRPLNGFKFPSVECINKECKNVKFPPGETYRCEGASTRTYRIPVFCINHGKPSWCVMPLTVNTCCVCRHYVCT